MPPGALVPARIGTRRDGVLRALALDQRRVDVETHAFGAAFPRVLIAQDDEIRPLLVAVVRAGGAWSQFMDGRKERLPQRARPLAR